MQNRKYYVYKKGGWVNQVEILIKKWIWIIERLANWDFRIN